MSNRKITKLHTFSKYAFQCFLVLLEFGGICAVFVYFTDKIVPCDTLVDYLERGTLGLALYEFLIFAILSSINDGIKDSLIALQAAYSWAILACEENSQDYFERTSFFVNSQLEPGRLNSTKIRKEYRILLDLMRERNLCELKYRCLLIEYQFNAADLKWRFTLLLRLFK